MESSKEKYMKENKNADKPSFVYRDGMTADTEYVEWLSDLKRRYKQSQLRTSVKANSEVLEYYWNLGRDIVAKEAESKWGSGFFNPSLIPDNYFQQFLGVFVGLTICFSATASWKIEL